MILIALGANLDSSVGEPHVTLKAALKELAAQSVRVLKVSALYRTPAWPDPADPPYVNAVAEIATERDPASLLTLLHAVEERFGRVRAHVNGPRTLDLDLLAYDERIETDWPVLPHPRLSERAFVLVPLSDIAPDWRHPVSRVPLSQLLSALPSKERDAVQRLS
ncbi:2-amino-4-hydroxy-6-hydroxymethyldihydropteridine diphosphokinase [Rhizomicrobium palustre]|uniref:2-amino-4-hydroxy-6-hydroxymethyldihydropteridine pyrophosphokinase n=1 Tax=Rhizomicrobium palustre TaxID=189966 RepID=A0A846N495_9PROT|nr:2-amino-4-hydroxy-6-hydroxymethyldihydropteridine diphosphokinase [Rhizomicrobium palustre]NIK90339.1 2-amino-4-hydroxy-6-hydroxymethyldihydropteridine diphosphokinase [Rhizomicrobium palustre]